jgi:hypothetical protein
MSLTLCSFVTTLIKTSAAPMGLSFFFYIFPGFRFAPPWANLWSRLRRLVHRSAIDLLNPKVSDIGL